MRRATRVDRQLCNLPSRSAERLMFHSVDRLDPTIRASRTRWIFPWKNFTQITQRNRDTEKLRITSKRDENLLLSIDQVCDSEIPRSRSEPETACHHCPSRPNSFTTKSQTIKFLTSLARFKRHRGTLAAIVRYSELKLMSTYGD